MNTVEILKTHNAWRRGDDTRSMDDLGFSVAELGESIDYAVSAIDERDQLRAELEECIRAWSLANADVKALRAELEKERERVNRLTEASKELASIVKIHSKVTNNNFAWAELEYLGEALAAHRKQGGDDD